MLARGQPDEAERAAVTDARQPRAADCSRCRADPRQGMVQRPRVGPLPLEGHDDRRPTWRALRRAMAPPRPRTPDPDDRAERCARRRRDTREGHEDPLEAAYRDRRRDRRPPPRPPHDMRGARLRSRLGAPSRRIRLLPLGGRQHAAGAALGKPAVHTAIDAPQGRRQVPRPPPLLRH